MAERNHHRATPRPGRKWERLWAAMEEIWQRQAASGQPAPTVEEDDARLRKLRRGWPEGYFGRQNSLQLQS